MARQGTKYLITQRLADVMALIQVLALDKEYRRSEQELRDELQGLPSSANTWTDVAQHHPEFFRVRGQASGEEAYHHRVSLLARHVRPLNAAGDRELPVEFVGKLLDAAIELHDRELTRHDRWKVLIPVIVGILAACATIIAAILKN